MIYTFTANPTIDYVIKADTLVKGQVNRSIKEYKYIGGKGLNVSQVLSNLGMKSVAIGFIGGFVGDKIKEEIEKVCDTYFIKVCEDSRINVKINSDTNIETEINAQGPTVSKENIDKLFLKLSEIKDEDIVVLSGNVQKSIGQDFYAKIMEYLNDKDIKCKVIVDAENMLLVNSLKYKPFLIKPNKQELASILKREIHSENDIIEGAKKLQEMGAINVIISMDGNGSIMVTENGVYKSQPIKGEVKNSVGAGDSMIAGFIYKYLESGNLKESFNFSNVVGAATAFNELLATKEDIDKLIKK